MMRTRLLALVFVVMWAVPCTAAVRLRFQSLRDGQSVQGSEVCFYPYRLLDPASGLFSPPYRCAPADKLIEASDAEFAYFIRHPAGLTSANPIVFAAKTGVDAVRSFSFNLVPGGTVDLSGIDLAPAEHLALILSGSNDSGPYVMPVKDENVLVPANVPIVPVVIRETSVVALGKPFQVAAGASARVTDLSKEPGVILRIAPTDPVTGILPGVPATLCEKSYGKDAIALFTKEDPPKATLTDAGRTVHVSLTAFAKTGHLLSGLVVFRGLKPGPATLAITGKHWQPAKYTIEIDGRIRVVDDRYGVSLGGSASILTLPPLSRILKSAGNDCDPRASNNAVISVARCAKDVPCTNVAEFPPNSDEEYSFDGLQPGKYEVVARFGDTVLASQQLEISLGKTSTATLSQTDAFYVTGRVTTEDKPLHGTIRFRNGRTVSGTNGEYDAVLPGDPGITAVNFLSCDEAVYYQKLLTTPLVSGSVLDIEVPNNVVAVDVRDGTTGQRLAQATAMVGILFREDDPDNVSYIAPSVHEDDLQVVRHLEEGKLFRVCAEAPDYQRVCDPEVRTKKKGRETVTISLPPGRLRHGTVLAAGYTDLYWSLADGTLTEAVKINEDGSFTYKNDHGRAEYVVLVGRAPLSVSPSPQADETHAVELSVSVQAGPDITVRLADQSSRQNALIALSVNGVWVPHQALVMHQLLRRQRMFIIRRAPVLFSGIGAGALVFAAGPDPDLLPRGTDLSNPAIFLGAPHKTPQNNKVTFE